MPLFWLVHEIDGERRVSIQEGSTLNFARLDAVIAGVEGVFVGGRMLDERHAKKVPKTVVGARGERADRSHVVTRRLISAAPRLPCRSRSAG